MNTLAIAILGALGAQTRHALSVAFDTKNFPYGVLISNIISCVAAAIIAATGAGERYRLFAAGFLAALSTFSSMNFALYEMLKQKRYTAAAVFFLLTTCGTFTAAAIIVLA